MNNIYVPRHKSIRTLSQPVHHRRASRAVRVVAVTSSFKRASNKNRFEEFVCA
jgi:hypothetical protein